MKAVVQQLPNGLYRATAIGLPFSADAESEADALRQLRETLTATAARVVNLDGDANPVTLSAFVSDVKDHPATEAFDKQIDRQRERVEQEANNTPTFAADMPSWQKLSGLLADDPYMEDFIEGIKQLREQRDREDGL